MEIVLNPRFTAERIAGLVAPYFSLTGAEIAVLLGSLDRVDRAAITLIDALVGNKISMRRLREVARATVGDKLGDRAVDRLVEYGILKRIPGRRLMHIPHPKTHSAITVIRNESFLLFASKSIGELIQVEEKPHGGVRVLVDGTTLGYACVKSGHDSTLNLATMVAAELSKAEFSARFKSWHFLLAGPRFGRVCWECLEGRGERWVNTGELAVKIYRWYRTKTGRVAIRYLRGKWCKYPAVSPKRCPGSLKGKLLSVKYKKLNISRLPLWEDESIKYVNFPKECVVGEWVCGLSLSVAVEMQQDKKDRKDPVGLALDEDSESVDSIIRALMDLKSAITPETYPALKILSKILKK